MPLSLIAIILVVLGWLYFLTRGRGDRRALVFNIVILTATTTLLSQTPEGRTRTWVAISAVVVLAAQVALNELMRRRIRELEATLTELQRREDRLEQVAEIAKLGYYVYDTVAEEVVECTEQHARNHGLSRREYLKQASTLSNEMLLIHPADRAELKAGYERVLRGEQVVVTYRVPTGDRTIHLKEITRPIFNDAGHVVAELGTTMDVTEQIETERQFLISQRLETSGRVAAGVAHDFNNLLSVVLVSLELLELDADESALRHIAAAVKAVERGTELARSLLGFTGQAEIAEQVFDLTEVLRRIAGTARSMAPATISVELDAGPDPWPILSDPGMTENAILNLVINAIDAMPTGGLLRLSTANIELPAETRPMPRSNGDTSPDPAVEAATGSNDELSPGMYVRLLVCDTGSGIEPDKLEQIFEPFYTSKRSSGGSGLGLSMVKGLMGQTGGKVEVRSELGVGTEFGLYFPAAIDPKAPIPEPVTPTIEYSPELLPARILVADDDTLVLEVVETMLTEAGYIVEPTSSGDRAFEAFATGPGFDLVITDIVMPGSRDGRQLARDLRDRHPDLPIIFISGYSPDPVENSDDLLLQKPFRRAALLEAVAELLSRSALPTDPTRPGPGLTR